MSEQLKPCPFCGGEAELISSEPSTANHNDGAVHSAVACFCFGCKVMPYPKLWHVNDSEAISAWNTRALTPKQQCADEMYEILNKVRLSQCMSRNEIEHSDLLSELHHDIEKVLAKAKGEA